CCRRGSGRPRCSPSSTRSGPCSRRRGAGSANGPGTSCASRRRSPSRLP
ncbi:MAG: hypothetical protein AVDCRST_MAG11-25, partial [uncultured Gemmatimonadaceae bacterium]